VAVLVPIRLEHAAVQQATDRLDEVRRLRLSLREPRQVGQAELHGGELGQGEIAARPPRFAAVSIGTPNRALSSASSA
jgi:hypothetical protein